MGFDEGLFVISEAGQCRFPVKVLVFVLQIATAGRGDFFGEQSVCSKIPKSSTSVIAASCVTMLVLQKWDVLNAIDQSLLAELPRFSAVGNIDDELLVEQFYRWVLKVASGWFRAEIGILLVMGFVSYGRFRLHLLFAEIGMVEGWTPDRSVPF